MDFKVLKRLIQFAKPYSGYMYLLIFLTISLALLVPIRPYLIQHIIDNELANGDHQGLLNMVYVLVGILIIQGFVQYSHTYLSAWVGQTIIMDIRTNLFSYVQRLNLKFFDKTPIGRLVTRNVSDIETLANVFSQGIAMMIGDLLQLVVILSFMFYTDWKLSLVSLSSIPILIWATYVFKEKIKVSFNHVRTAVANLNSFVQEHITGMSIVQIFNSEEVEYRKFKEINEEHKKANIKSVLYYSVYFPVAEVIQAIAIGLLVWYGAVEMMDSTYQPGVIIAFIMYIMMFFRPIRMIADKFNTLQMGIVSTNRIITLLDNKDHIPNDGEYAPEHIDGNVTFKDVWFAYNDEDYVLKNINFEVKSGQTIALVGATGAGKSSVINLLSRFYDIKKGEILLDDRSVAEYELAALRKNIGVVLQDVFLFSDSIEKNITLGNNDISRAQVQKAAELVGAMDFIKKLPSGFDYNVMERGSTLSVGQRQLISFVRAMVYDPKIIVLDEATSSVDTETEELIQQAISKMMTGRTSIVIAHRLSTIQHADQIIVLDKGEIKEVGTHDELLAKDSFYAQLHRMQYKEVLTT
ncbi:ABC transporter ATP-binding protein [Reichenbachiella versicolor]|uniref:ABC transporter ATP-binding protein n=1 Tax=Reichenbachiella versicolor TaxID=1821036 RepID=UPI000D6DCC33|nr:ABC transporter ATP-binding protein [Reichenbachiella versicolor]